MKARKTLCFLMAMILGVASVILPASALANGVYLPQNSTVRFTYNLSDLYTDETSTIATTSLPNELAFAFRPWNIVRNDNGVAMVTIDFASASSNFAIIPVNLGSDGNIIGYTLTTPRVEAGGQVRNASIQLNNQVYWSTSPNSTQYDIGSVVAHEIGHTLGLAHCHEAGYYCTSATCSANLMHPTLAKGQTKITTSTYDEASLLVIYDLNFYGYFD